MDDIADIGSGEATPAAARLVRCAPIPVWAQHEPYPSQIPQEQVSCVGNGVCRLLHDVQVDLSGPEFGWHYRTAQRILTREGAERAAHVVVDFDPGFQRLDIHFVRVLRDGESIDHNKPGAFQVFRRETNLESRVLNGRLTASLLVPDVRVNDIVEISLTLYGSVPVLQGRHASWVGFDLFNPFFENRYRLVRPQDRPIFTKAFNEPPQPVVETRAGVEDSRWCLVGQSKVEPEPLTPPWLVLVPAIQFSEYGSWNDVAIVLAPYYEGGSLPTALVAEVDRIANDFSDPAQQAVEWLRFVQQELRYFALSLGEGGLTPRALNAIWDTRFGDCKDKASLYVAGARRMGLDASAALVSTTHGPMLDRFLPSPVVFNHCIVRVRLNGASYWLDPTVPVQSGRLDVIDQPCVGWTLPLSSETTQLEKLPGAEPLHVVHCEDEISVGRTKESPAKFSRHIDYHGWVADNQRNRIANEGPAEYARAMLKELQAIWPATTETKAIEMSDDRYRNSITVSLSYELRECWKPNENGSRLNFTLADLLVSRELGQLSGSPRRTDVYLGRPRKITRSVLLEMPCAWSGPGWSHVLEAPGIKFVDRFTAAGRSVRHARELLIENWSLPAEAADEYGSVVKKLRENVLLIWASERFGKIRPVTAGGLRLYMRLAIWLALMVIWLLIMFLKELVPSHH